MKHPLKTPSGKIEIYSEQLARETADWEIPEDGLDDIDFLVENKDKIEAWENKNEA